MAAVVGASVVVTTAGGQLLRGFQIACAMSRLPIGPGSIEIEKA
jgi:hypothetical protein